MQRIVSQTPRVATTRLSNAVLGGSNAAGTHVQPPHQDWDFVDFARAPVSIEEVAVSLEDLRAVLVGQQTQYAVSNSSSDISEGFMANSFMTSAEDDNVIDALNSIVTNVLNNPIAGPEIANILAQDPTYHALIRKCAAQQQQQSPGLLPGSSPLLLPGPEGWRPVGEQDPLFKILQSIFGKITNAVCMLGGAVRKLPGDIALLLKSFGGIKEDHVRTPLAAEDFNTHFNDALQRVVVAAAVAVITRRALIRLA